MGDGDRVTVRPASPADIPALVEINRASKDDAELPGFGLPADERLFGNVERLTEAWRPPNLARSEEVFVAELDGVIVGFVLLEDRGHVLELDDIEVRQALRGRGIGTRLVRFVEERAVREGKSAVTLGTSRNAAGVPWSSFPWWQALGYRVTGEEINAWTRRIGEGVREIRMRKEVP